LRVRAAPRGAVRRTRGNARFWGKRAFQGTYEGFRIIDIRSSRNPREIINYADCSPGTTQGNHGRVVVWDDILVRCWNSPATATSTCDGQLVGLGFEGLHVFDISNPRDPTWSPKRVTINPPSSAAGTYEAAGAAVRPGARRGRAQGGGDWSAYWYHGEIYESDMTRGLTIWDLKDRAVRGARKLGHLNPQTQEPTIALKRDRNDDEGDEEDDD
jgi:hypothetical protein